VSHAGSAPTRQTEESARSSLPCRGRPGRASLCGAMRPIDASPRPIDACPDCQCIPSMPVQAAHASMPVQSAHESMPVQTADNLPKRNRHRPGGRENPLGHHFPCRGRPGRMPLCDATHPIDACPVCPCDATHPIDACPLCPLCPCPVCPFFLFFPVAPVALVALVAGVASVFLVSSPWAFRSL